MWNAILDIVLEAIKTFSDSSSSERRAIEEFKKLAVKQSILFVSIPRYENCILIYYIVPLLSYCIYVSNNDYVCSQLNQEIDINTKLLNIIIIKRIQVLIKVGNKNS